ncbi:HesB/YadR/YfhF family protein [Virgibacillus doumboii]|uniref:HesB/YadR/YfhF family protein n=1 Tax=Virgibacillus doumboii TaxID=2697503 RepID=UPI0013DF548C|nr:hypothetical protein [Virgibacillus doumboii]
MNLSVTENAAKWYKSEFEIEQSAQVQFFVRYGFGGIIPGFSLGVRLDKPVDIYASCESEGITFFIDSKDAWYFDDKNLKIQLDEQTDEPEFIYS